MSRADDHQAMIRARIADLKNRLADLVAEEAGVRKSAAESFAGGRPRWQILDAIISQKKEVGRRLRDARRKFGELVSRPRPREETS